MSAPLQGLEAWGSRCATGVQEIPQRLIVVGGVVACEAATWMSSLGNDVTMLVRGPRLLSAAESFASRFIEKALAARGITVITDAQVVAAERPQASDTGLGRVHGGPSRSPAPVEPSRLMRSWSPLAVARYLVGGSWW